jgi:tripeptidyl-peptidase-1
MNPNTTFDLISVDDGINNQLPAGAGFFTVCLLYDLMLQLANCPQNPDVQWAVGLATDVPVTFISTGTVPNDIVTEMLDQAHYLLSLEHPPQTLLNSDTPGLESQVSSPPMAVCVHNGSRNFIF